MMVLPIEAFVRIYQMRDASHLCRQRATNQYQWGEKFFGVLFFMSLIFAGT